MTKLIVDGIEVEVPPEYTLLQACEAAGAEIPRFCFHERLSIAGNCRMCLVEVKGAPKPVASCAWGVRDCRPGPNGEPPQVLHQVADGQEGARRGDGVPAHQPPARLPDLRPGRRVRPAGPGDGLRVRRHPLPREQARRRGQVYRPARRDQDEPLHPLHALHPLRRPRSPACRSSARSAAARTWRSRPISSTAMRSELQGNVVDLCPVGALVHKPQNYNMRPWELTKTESVDVMDAVGSAIRVDAARPRGDAHPAADQRGDQRGVDLRQDAPGRRTACALQRLDRPYLRDGGRLRAGDLGRGVRDDRRAAARARRQAHRRHRRRSRRGRGDVRAEAPDAEPRARRTSIAGRTAATLDPALGRASYLFNADDRRHRAAPTRSCSSAPTRASRRRCSTPASASAGAMRARCRSA